MISAISDSAVAALCAALVALAVPINTYLLIVLNTRQKKGNQHTETIRQLSYAVSQAGGPTGEVAPIPPEEIGDRVVDALHEAREKERDA